MTDPAHLQAALERGARALFMCSDMKFNSWEDAPDAVKDEYRFAANQVFKAAQPQAPVMGGE